MIHEPRPRTIVQTLLQHLYQASGADDSDRLMTALLRPDQAQVISFLNAHAVNLAASDPRFAGNLLQSDYLLRDGSGVKMGCLMLGVAPGVNLNGTDLIPRLLDGYRDRRIALFGAEPYWLTRALETLKGSPPGFAAMTGCDGFRAEDEYLKLALETRPELIVLGLGMPRQESLAIRLRDVMREAGAPCTIVNGGAIIDFMAGKFPRAPAAFRKTGLEWVFRLAMEPRRLAKRYVLGNPLFIYRVVMARLALRGDATPT